MDAKLRENEIPTMYTIRRVTVPDEGTVKTLHHWVCMDGVGCAGTVCKGVGCHILDPMPDPEVSGRHFNTPYCPFELVC
jgi:hypothetical protein